ncbi:unnamed protein product [Eruca vesicaria subsp. sativa]|uniref:Uncharacterized protein n=1 Tax=Eruca vesicaria subsp. sativa TaxID=29727 RepID=A0ABC8K7W4_ERUVS|nr:unnamed protein product [Eruca vesicaria subsp. sativa]
MYSSIARKVIGEGRQSPLVMGLISVIKSTSSAPESTLLGVSPSKSSSLIPWMNKVKIDDVDRRGTAFFDNDEDEDDEKGLSGGSGWVSRLLSMCSEDAKASFTVVAVSLLFRSALAESKSIHSASMYPTLDVGR